VRVPLADAEEARARFLELAPEGFEEVTGGAWLELALYTDDDVTRRVRAAYPNVDARPVAEGWEERWRAFHRPVEVAGLWLGPPWETPPEPSRAVVVDPGRAFGTGAHPTTRACVELLAAADRGSVLDAGCGSGVLAVASARLGFDPVFAVDLDPTAVAVAAETVRRNGVGIDVRAADVLHDALPRVDLVVANLDLPTVRALLSLRPAGRAIVSGYLDRDVVDASGWRPVARIELEGWAAETFEAL
jgi:ribosomal protein L11 methyltransferase